MLLGIVQSVLWIWVIFLIITMVSNTEVGAVLMHQIESDIVLHYLYEKERLTECDSVCDYGIKRVKEISKNMLTYFHENGNIKVHRVFGGLLFVKNRLIKK